MLANVNGIPDEAQATPSPVLWSLDYFHRKRLNSYIPGSLLAFHSHIMLATQPFHDQVIPSNLFLTPFSFQLMRPLD